MFIEILNDAWITLRLICYNNMLQFALFVY